MNICVFCASSNGIDEVYFRNAEQLGKLMAENNFGLVYGGANVGLMEHLAVSVKVNGGKAIGIIPQKIHDYELSSSIPDQLIVTETMDLRKSKMREKSDAFVALPGGFGTLEEILEVITLRQLDYHQKPVVFLNTNGFYDDLFRQFEKSFNESFAKESYRSLYYIASTPNEAIDYIKNFSPKDLGTKWFKVPQK
jgi:uncharacterized protein (TIGR00730 family)